MKKIFLLVFFCSLVISNFAFAKMYKNTDELWYWDFEDGRRGNYLMWDYGRAIGIALDLNSVHLISHSDYSCEFNIIDVAIEFKSNQIISHGTMHFFEDYETGGIYYENFDENGKKNRISSNA